MKRYRLLKDSPYVKAGAVFVCETIRATEIMALESPDDERPGLIVNKIIDFDEWFEEIKEPELPEEFFYINIDMVTGYSFSYFSMDENTRQEYIRFMERHKSVGNFFETKEEAEKYLEYLKAKAIIKQDTKGFKPDWNNGDETKFFGYWDFILEEPGHGLDCRAKIPNIYFQSPKDIKESFKKHPEEWRTYLAYKQ